MLTLSVKKRKVFGGKAKILREKGILPAVLYGPKIKNLDLEIDLKEFEKVYREAGESSLVFLEINPEGKQTSKKNSPVLIHDVQLNPLTGTSIHVDFYQPSLTEETTVNVPVVFEGEAQAVKELGGTLIKNISEIEVKALPQDLPHEIKVNIDSLLTFDHRILIRDIKIPPKVKIMNEPSEIVALVSAPEKVEEELEKPIEESAEAEKVEEKRKEEQKSAE